MGLAVALDIGWGVLSPAQRTALATKVCTETEQLMNRVRYSELVSGSRNPGGRGFKLTDNGTWWARSYIQNHVSTPHAHPPGPFVNLIWLDVALPHQSAQHLMGCTTVHCMLSELGLSELGLSPLLLLPFGAPPQAVTNYLALFVGGLFCISYDGSGHEAAEKV